MTPKGRRPRRAACLSCPRPSQLPETRHRVETRMLVAACDGHACCDWLGIAVCESQTVASPPGSPGRRADHPLAPSSAPDAMAPPGSHADCPPHPSAAPACQRARPARRDSLGTADATSAASPAPSGHPFRARGSLLSGARKAYRTSVPVSRDTNRRLVDAAHTKRSRVVPSLKELRKLTIQKTAMSSGMQVVVRDARHTALSVGACGEARIIPNE